MAAKKEEIYLIDGSSYIYRAYHTIQGLSNAKGLPTGAILGFTNMLVKTLKDKQPTRIAVVFDARGPTFRHEKLDEYKATRPPMPDDLAVQISVIRDLVEAYRLPMLSVPGYEADDIIATLVSEARSEGFDVVIVSGDKDLMQLVDDHVRMWDPQRDKVYDIDGVKAKFGVGPEQLLDLLAMMGDTSDNIPGVPGVGPKTAAKLIQDFGSLDGVYEHIEEVSPKGTKEKLAANRDKAYLSRDLVHLDDRVPLDTTVDRLKMVAPNVARLKELFKELEFKRHLDELPPEKVLDYSGYETVTTTAALTAWVERIRRAKKFAIVTESTSEQPVVAELAGISLSCEGGTAAYIPVGHTYGDQLGKKQVCDVLKPILEDPTIEKIGHNIKSGLIAFRKEGTDIRGIACDTMLASYLLGPSGRGNSLEILSLLFLDHAMIPLKDLIGTGKNQKLFTDVDIPEASEYAAEDADVTFRIAELLCPRIDEEGLGDLFRNIELPLVPILAEMEIAGVKVDPAYLRQLSKEFGSMIAVMETEIYQLAGGEFNINSPKQLGEVLFEKLRLRSIKKTKTGPSTSLDVLEQLALEHDLPRKILDYRSIFKLKSTYVDALAGLVNSKTGRIHTSYNQAVAATGRLSSSDPNLQNIPIRTPEGRKIRRAFVPEDGYLFVAADYSQIELRLMAHISQDERLREAFTSGEDVHSLTAANVFGVKQAHVTSEMRQKAKVINFGIMYGMGPFNLSQQLGVGLKMAKIYLEEYYETYAGVKRYMDEVPEIGARDGFVTTILGRKRYLPDLNSPNKIQQQAARRMAINTPVQGSAADLIKLAMIRVDEGLRQTKLPARMILQVHDELILEVREEAAAEAAALLKKEMEEVYPLSVPLLVETATGKNWDEAH